LPLTPASPASRCSTHSFSRYCRSRHRDLHSFPTRRSSDLANHLLGNVIVTEHLKAANEIAQKTNRRFRIVTLEGDMVYPGGSMSGGAKRKQNQSLFTREKELQTLTEKLIDYKQRAINFTNKVEQKKADVARLTTTLAEEEKALQHNERILQQLKEDYHLF